MAADSFGPSELVGHQSCTKFGARYVDSGLYKYLRLMLLEMDIISLGT